MARSARPRYSHEKRAYFAYVHGRKVRLVKGEENPTNNQFAERTLRHVLRGSKNDTPTGVRVADVVERYLKLHESMYSKRAFEERRHYLQLFAEAHGFRKVCDKDCLPVLVEEWLAEHPEWASDWTRTHIVSVIMRPFNWAAKKRIVASNPFRGIDCVRGQPRRPLTDDVSKEFHGVVASRMSSTATTSMAYWMQALMSSRSRFG